MKPLNPQDKSKIEDEPDRRALERAMKKIFSRTIRDREDGGPKRKPKPSKESR